MVKIGVIGAGLMGTLHVKSMIGNHLIKINAICDVRLESAQELAGGAPVYTDVDEMLAKSDIDAVIIATPDNLHAEPVIKCANAKKAMMIEKPFATNVEDGKRMLDAIARNGVQVQMAHLFRFMPIYMNIKNAVKAGEFGDILSTNFLMLNKLFVPTKMLSWSANSSPSWFLLSHALDATMWINNCRVKSLSAVGVKKKLLSMGINTYDLVKVTATLENGCISTFEANWVIPDSKPLTASVNLLVSGTNTAMTVDAGVPIVEKLTPESYSIGGIFDYDLYGYYSGLRRNMIETFARSIDGGVPTVTNEWDGYHTLCVLSAIDESMENQGKTIEINY